MGANGLWIENGKINGSVGGVTVATALNDFLNNITQFENDLHGTDVRDNWYANPTRGQCDDWWYNLSATFGTKLRIV